MCSPFVFRPLRESDLPLLHQWLHKPHVIAGWREILDLPGTRAKYQPRIAGTEPTHVFIIEYLHQPVGWIQWYRWSHYPGHAQKLDASATSAGIDLALGEENTIGKSLGSRIIRQFLDQFVFTDPAISQVLTDPQSTNHRSLRAFAKAGFTVVKTVQLPGENFERSVVSLVRPS